ncbi:YkvI family membrane protein [Corynebacterium lehmanniae]
MWKRSLAVAASFVGIVVGAGFASGMEALQYFVAYGTNGFFGVILASVTMLFAATAFMTFGSYFLAREHNEVFYNVTSKPAAFIMDWSAVACMFSVGFVMFAGAGSNLQQSFGWPIWVGAVAMLALMLIVGRFDVDKVSSVIGWATPLLVVFVLIGSIYSFTQVDVNWSEVGDYAQQEVARADGTPYWWLGALNHTGLNALCGVSMALVMAGDEFDTKSTRYGGILGGVIYAVMLALLVASLLIQVESVNGADMPLLAVIDNVDPVLGFIMTWVIFLMVFNTCLGMFYALAKRLTSKHPERFYPTYAIACVVGFGLSFAGFQPLVNSLYPILGYLGLFVMAVMTVTYLRHRDELKDEGERRADAVEAGDGQEVEDLAAESNLEEDEFKDAVQEEVESSEDDNKRRSLNDLL